MIVAVPFDRVRQAILRGRDFVQHLRPNGGVRARPKTADAGHHLVRGRRDSLHVGLERLETE
jgi:hypothetical protein